MLFKNVLTDKKLVKTSSNNEDIFVFIAKFPKFGNKSLHLHAQKDYLIGQYQLFYQGYSDNIYADILFWWQTNYWYIFY